MTDKIADFKVEDLTWETEKELIRQEVLKEIAEKVREGALTDEEINQILDEDAECCYHDRAISQATVQKVLGILEGK